MRKSVFIGILIINAMVSHLMAQDDISPSSLKELISEAISNNPEIESTRAQLKSVKTRVSGLRYLNDPLIGIEFLGEMRMYSITQQLPFPTKILAMSHIARVDVEQYEHMLDATAQEVVFQVKKRYAELFFVGKKIETTKKSIVFLKQLFHIASQKYALGDVSQTDILRAQLELTIAEERLLTLVDDRAIAVVQLNLLLNRERDAPLSSPSSLTYEEVTIPLDSLYDMALSHHPTLKAYALGSTRATLIAALAKQKYLPDLMVKYTQLERDNDFTDQRYMFGFTVPVWFWGKQSAFVNEAKANMEIAANDFKAVENKVLLAVKENKVRVDKNKRITDLYSMSILPQAEANLRSAFVAYEANQSDFLDLLESEKLLIQYELDYYRAQTDLFTANASLEQAVGIDFIDE